MTKQVALKDLLREKHWQTYRMFCNQYDRAAKKLDSTLVGTYPSRAQLHRWLSGDLKGLPYPHHCQVLEEMFPGVTVSQMFEPAIEQRALDISSSRVTVAELLTSIEESLDSPASSGLGWSRANLAADTGRLTTTMRFPLKLDESVHDATAEGSPAHIARSVLILGKRLRLSEAEVVELAQLAGNLVYLEMECSIDIDADGWSAVTYRFEVLNLTNNAIRRIIREQWFETTDGPLRIEPNDTSDRRVWIQRMHDTANMTKFACQFSPPIEPGGVGIVAYTTRRGRFTHDHYWRQSTSHYVRHFTLDIRHRNIGMLLGCTAIEDQADGSQLSAIDDLVCTDEDGDALITVTRDYLQPGQAVTLRWEVSRAAS